jgi:uncharacterized protein
MSTIDERRERASAGLEFRDEEAWRDGFARPRVVLQPVAAPSILGLFGFAGATLIVAANLAGWYGNPTTPEYLAPFAAFFGGLAQFMAGMWAYRARDAVATAMHGMWGSFWLAYGLLWLLVATGQLAPGTTMDQALAFWFIALAAITISGMFGALVEGKLAVTVVLATLAVGASFAAVGLGWEGTFWEHAAGWLFVISAGCAWYTATAMMLAAASGRTVLPLFSLSAAANVPGRRPLEAVELPWAEPGIKHGQ